MPVLKFYATSSRPVEAKLINFDQIEEWIHEAEQRPTSASLIIEYVARRLRDLSSRNEELLAENIALRSGKKVEEYESRIANLEYQLDLLKRQVGGDLSLVMPAAPPETICLLVYNNKGQVLRIDLPVADLTSGSVVANLAQLAAGGPPRLLVTSSTEELLFVFDSGRTVALPADDLPAVNATAKLEWKHGQLIEPRGGEELAVITPIARMTLFDYCIQTSRRGCAKRMMKTSFEAGVAKTFVGAGVKAKPDKTCDLTLCGKEDSLALVTREGFLVGIDVGQLPYTIEEIFKIGPTDYVVSSFVLGRKSSLLVMTHNGKAINREVGWLEKVNSFKGRGQPIFSSSRREAGVRVSGAAAVDDTDWAASLGADGSIRLYQVADLLQAGAVGDGAEIAEFVTFSAPKPGKG